MSAYRLESTWTRVHSRRSPSIWLIEELSSLVQHGSSDASSRFVNLIDNVVVDRRVAGVRVTVRRVKLAWPGGWSSGGHCHDWLAVYRRPDAMGWVLTAEGVGGARGLGVVAYMEDQANDVESIEHQPACWAYL